MPIKYGSTTIQKIVYNGVDLDKVYYGSTLVFSKAEVPHVAFDGSNFYGVFSGGVYSGILWRYNAYSSGQRYSNTANGYTNDWSTDNGVTITKGPITFSGNYAKGFFSMEHFSLATRSEMNFTPFSKISVKQTGTWYGRGATTNNGYFSYISTHNIKTMKYDTQYSKFRYYEQSEISYTRSGTWPTYGSGNNGWHTTTWTDTFNISQVTGQFYLGIFFMAQCEESNIGLSTTVNEIKFE